MPYLESRLFTDDIYREFLPSLERELPVAVFRRTPLVTQDAVCDHSEAVEIDGQMECNFIPGVHRRPTLQIHVEAEKRK